MNAPLDLHLSSSADPTPQPDSTLPITELLPPPAPVQPSQAKRKTGSTPFFTQTQEPEATGYKNMKRPKLNSEASQNDASPLIPPSAPIVGTTNTHNPSPHPWQSLPQTPPPPDHDAASSFKLSPH